MAKATIGYTGIIGFYYWADENLIMMLVPSARNMVHHPHYAWLECCASHVTSSSLTPSKHSTSEVYSFEIQGEMTFEGGARQGLSSEGFESKLVPLADCDVEPEVGKLKADLLRGSFDDRVVLRSALSYGTLSSHCTTGPWRFSHWKSGKDSIELAQLVTHQFNLTGEQLTIRIKRGVVEHEIVLDDQGDDVGAIIKNTPRPFPTGSPHEDDVHVRLYNKLAMKTKPSHTLSYLQHNGEVPDWPVKMRMPHGANCPPGWWDEAG